MFFPSNQSKITPSLQNITTFMEVYFLKRRYYSLHDIIPALYYDNSSTGMLVGSTKATSLFFFIFCSLLYLKLLEGYLVQGRCSVKYLLNMWMNIDRIHGVRKVKQELRDRLETEEEQVVSRYKFGEPTHSEMNQEGECTRQAVLSKAPGESGVRTGR